MLEQVPSSPLGSQLVPMSSQMSIFVGDERRSSASCRLMYFGVYCFVSSTASSLLDAQAERSLQNDSEPLRLVLDDNANAAEAPLLV